MIYRVKSAQKIKLTDRQLSQRLAPILALYIVYLLAWSLAKSSHVIEMKMTGGLRFEECSVDWWDHAILICEYSVPLLLCGVVGEIKNLVSNEGPDSNCKKITKLTVRAFAPMKGQRHLWYFDPNQLI